jgi:hypothetical protein
VDHHDKVVQLILKENGKGLTIITASTQVRIPRESKLLYNIQKKKKT